MKLFIIAAAFLGLGVLAREADGAERAAKPVVCANYVIAKNLGICQDGKRPVVLTRFSEVQVEGPEGQAPVKVLVGWR